MPPALAVRQPRAAAAAPGQRIESTLRPPAAVRNSPAIEPRPRRSVAAARPSSPSSILLLSAPRAAAAAPDQRIESTTETPSRCAQQPAIKHRAPVGRRRGRSPRRPEVHPRAPSPPALAAIRKGRRRGPLPLHPDQRIESTPETPNRCAQQPGDRAASPVGRSRPLAPQPELHPLVVGAAGRCRCTQING